MGFSRAFYDFGILCGEGVKKVQTKGDAKYFIIPGIMLCRLSFWNGSDQFEVIPGAELIYILILAVILCLGVKQIKGAKMSMYVFLFYQILAFWYPSFYSILYPYNNMEEDLGWAVYDMKSLVIMFVISVIIIMGMFLLNRFFWKARSLWLCNVLIVSWLIMRIIVFKLGMTPYFVKSGVWIFAFLLLWWLTRKNAAVFSIKNKISLAVFIFLIPALIAGIVFVSKNSVKLKTKEYQGKDFSYIAKAEDRSGKERMINERGEEVFSCGDGLIGESKIYGNDFLVHIYDSTGEYLFNDRGEIISDQYDEYVLLEHSNFILVLKYRYNGKKYGAINSDGDLVIPLKYDSEEELCKAEGIDDIEVEEDNTIYEDDDLKIVGETGKQGVVRKDGTEILPSKYLTVSLIDAKSVYICAKQTAIDEINGNYEVGFNQALFDQNGKELIPFGDHDLSVGSENGWIQVNDLETGIKFLNQDLKEVLNLGKRYKKVGSFRKIRK